MVLECIPQQFRIVIDGQQIYIKYHLHRIRFAYHAYNKTYFERPFYNFNCLIGHYKKLKPIVPNVEREPN